MKRKIIQIRKMEVIEKELNTNHAGILAVVVDNEKVIQFPTTFIYLDKNIYIFFDNENELLQNIQFGTKVLFTILKSDKIVKEKELDFEPTYSMMYVSISGLIKRIDELKTITELQNTYLKKYKKKFSDKVDLTYLTNVVMIDTEEIQAFEEIGG